MDLKIKCPNCDTMIDVKKQIGGFVDELGKKQAGRIVEEERQKAADKARAEERAKAEKDNKKLLGQVSTLTSTVERNERETEAKAENLAKQRLEPMRAEIESEYEEKLEHERLATKEAYKKLWDAQSKAQQLEAKLRQGSPGVQGILAESDLFQYLLENMPQDCCDVEKVGQGRDGTDVLIHVHKNNQRIGSIIVEGKRTTEWNTVWPEKTWRDKQKHNADFAFIIVNRSGFPEDNKDKKRGKEYEALKTAGFGLAPCRRSGVQIWLVDRSNLALALSILIDCVEKIRILGQYRDVYGAGSEPVKQLKAYLTKGYEIDLRDKAMHMSAAVKSLNDMYKKVNTEYEKTFEALRSYWTTEQKVNRQIMVCFGESEVKSLPQIAFTKER